MIARTRALDKRFARKSTFCYIQTVVWWKIVEQNVQDTGRKPVAIAQNLSCFLAKCPVGCQAKGADMNKIPNSIQNGYI